MSKFSCILFEESSNIRFQKHVLIVFTDIVIDKNILILDLITEKKDINKNSLNIILCSTRMQKMHFDGTTDDAYQIFFK